MVPLPSSSKIFITPTGNFVPIWGYCPHSPTPWLPLIQSTSCLNQFAHFRYFFLVESCVQGPSLRRRGSELHFSRRLEGTPACAVDNGTRRSQHPFYFSKVVCNATLRALRTGPWWGISTSGVVCPGNGPAFPVLCDWLRAGYRALQGGIWRAGSPPSSSIFL